MKKKRRGHALPDDAPEIDGAVSGAELLSRANGDSRLGRPERNAADDEVAYIGPERRDAIERRDAWRCLKCNGTEPRIAGSPGIGVQIRKCNACGMMDRRLPNERRQRWTPEGVQVRFTAAGPPAADFGTFLYFAALVGGTLAVLALGVLLGQAVLK